MYMSKKPANVQRKALKELQKGWRNTEQNLKQCSLTQVFFMVQELLAKR